MSARSSTRSWSTSSASESNAILDYLKFWHLIWKSLPSNFVGQFMGQVFFWVSDPLCLSSSSSLHFFRLFFLVHLFGPPASPCTCNDLWRIYGPSYGTAIFSYKSWNLGIHTGIWALLIFE
jgi:hypothetical protein